MSVDWEGSAAGQPSPLATQMPIEAARQLRSTLPSGEAMVSRN